MTAQQKIQRYGLSEASAKTRLLEEGPNELPKHNQRTAFRIILEVLREPMLALLIGGGVVYLAIGDVKEAIILLVFACLSVLITVVQEARTERVLDALRDLTSPRALVIRGGERKRIAGREVVRGDLIILAEGDRVPADALLLSAQDLQADESLLTGESVPVRKREAAASQDIPPRPGGDDLPFVYSGSLIVRGLGTAEVMATGPRSEIGRIGQSLGNLETTAPHIQTQTRKLVSIFALVGAAVSLLVVVLLWNLKRWLARRDPGGHRSGYVDAAGGIPGRPCRLHGDGRMAYLAGPGSDAARERHRSTRVGDGLVHGQDWNTHRKPHDDCRTSAS